MAKPGSRQARAIAQRHARDRQEQRDPTAIDTTDLDRFVAVAESGRVNHMWLMAYEYPEMLQQFREKNWRALRALGMQPAPAPRGTVQQAVEDGWYKTRLRDGTDGYFMRRGDDCSTATVATLVGCHPSLVPDPHEMQRILSGTDPLEVMAGLDDAYEVFAEQAGVRLRQTTEPPFWSRRWIGVVERDPDNPLANHLMVMSGRELLFDTAHTYPHPDNQHTMLDGWGVDDISFGYVLED